MRWLRRRQQGVLGDLNKDVFLKSEMKNVVKYYAKLDILLVGSIYVTTYTYIYIYIYIYYIEKENPKSPSSCKPRHPGLGTVTIVIVEACLVCMWLSYLHYVDTICTIEIHYWIFTRLKATAYTIYTIWNTRFARFTLLKYIPYRPCVKVNTALCPHPNRASERDSMLGLSPMLFLYIVRNKYVRNIVRTMEPCTRG